MKDDNQDPQNLKKGFPNGFVYFLLLSFMLVFLLQNIANARYAEVASSHELEHLVNLDLIKKEESRKVALNENLVSFSGRFKDKMSQEGEKRYKYLKHLRLQQKLEIDKKNLLENLSLVEQNIRQAADWFLQLKGHNPGELGYRVVDSVYDSFERQNQVVLHQISERDLVNLLEIRARLAAIKTRAGPEDIEDFESSFRSFLENFSSPILGIGSEGMKSQVRAVKERFNQALKQRERSRKFKTYEELTDKLEDVLEQLEDWRDHIRLNELRSVRKYREQLFAYQDLLKKIDDNQALLDKDRREVSEIIWFFNDQPVSTKILEKQDPELFNQWFLLAKSQWDAFEKNKGSVFRVPDQSRTQVLEREFKSEEQAPPYINYFLTILPVLLVFMLLYFVFSKQMKGMGSNAMNFGKSPARLLTKGQNKISFKDVAGIDEAREELEEIVEFLKNPGKFTALGGRIPKGVLCIGPPGTGKTLIAKAVAGEAERPFFSISGSDFVEMFVGVGASRIRDMFEQAKKNAPCIIFMDEIDAVGRHRGAGIGGGHDEREQTLNQLLVEMDGFDSKEGVILMAATNRPDVLDKALLRPGRFDRRIVLDLPDVKGRQEILQLHAQKIKMDDSVDLSNIAKSTPGASGADLENLLNEAALLAARNNRQFVTSTEVFEARDKVRYGKERRSLEIDENEKETTAYHESGHAVVAMIVEHAEPIEKVTIIPRGVALGGTHFLPKKNRLSYWKKEILDQIAVLMGGRVAEEIFVGDISSGASNDIERATAFARSMVCEWGMSELGTISYEEREQAGQYLGVNGYREKKYSESTAQAIDKEVHKIIDQGYARARLVIEDHKEQLKLMTDMLMDFETLDYQDVEEIMNGTWKIEEKRERIKKAADLHKLPSSPPPPPAIADEETQEDNGRQATEALVN